MAILQDVFSKLAENQLADKKLRETELATIENRFTAQHTQLTTTMQFLTTLQNSIDMLSNRMPDENQSKTRQVEVTGH